MPVAISNGWGDDLGPSEWKPIQRDVILRLFRERLQQNQRVRYLTTDPAGLVARGPHVPAPGDPLPAPCAGHGQLGLGEPRKPRHGVLRRSPQVSGQRRDRRRARRHRLGRRPRLGERDGAELPQWLQVDFGQTRPVSRFVVITYEHEKSMETAGKWGVLDYEIQAWDAVASQWRTVVTERQGRAAKVRVHTLAHPVTAQKIRLVVHRVLLDGRVRLLQLEAWGPAWALGPPETLDAPRARRPGQHSDIAGRSFSRAIKIPMIVLTTRSSTRVKAVLGRVTLRISRSYSLLTIMHSPALTTSPAGRRPARTSSPIAPRPSSATLLGSGTSSPL